MWHLGHAKDNVGGLSTCVAMKLIACCTCGTAHALL